MDKKDLRIIFMGTPEFAVESLRSLLDGGYNVVAVVTQPDKSVGRHGSVLQASAVKEYALSHGLPVLQPEKMKDPIFVEKLKSYDADLQVVVAYRMLPEVVWSMPHYGTFNVHAALLPQYRGAAPINWAVINGETKTGVTTFFLDHDIDTGRIIMQKEFIIPDDADVEYVYDGLMRLGAQVCISTVDAVINGDGRVAAIDQPDNIEFKKAPKIFKETCQINWKQDAKRIHDFIRGLSPYPGAWTTLCCNSDKSSSVLKIFKTCKTGRKSVKDAGVIFYEHNRLFINTIDELLEIIELQLAGKKRMPAKSFINGFHNLEDFYIS